MNNIQELSKIIEKYTNGKATKYALAIKSGSANKIITTIKKLDPLTIIDPERNPVRMWVITVLDINVLKNIENVEDIIHAKE